MQQTKNQLQTSSDHAIKLENNLMQKGEQLTDLQQKLSQLKADLKTKVCVGINIFPNV